MRTGRGVWLHVRTRGLLCACRRCDRHGVLARPLGGCHGLGLQHGGRLSGGSGVSGHAASGGFDGLDQLPLPHPASARNAKTRGQLLELGEHHAIQAGAPTSARLCARFLNGRILRLGTGLGCRVRGSEQIGISHAGSFPWTGAGRGPARGSRRGTSPRGHAPWRRSWSPSRGAANRTHLGTKIHEMRGEARFHGYGDQPDGPWFGQA